jgi:hypothetical protein
MAGLNFLNYISHFFLISLAITFILIVFLIYHYKERIFSVEKKVETMFGLVSSVVKEMENIKGVTFDWKESNVPSAGLLAQDVEKYLPQLIHIDENGTKALNYNGVIGVLVEAVKELSERVKQLESK